MARLFKEEAIDAAVSAFRFCSEQGLNGGLFGIFVFFGFQFTAKGKSQIATNAVYGQSVASTIEPFMETQEAE